MNKMVLFLLLAFSSVLAFSSANSQVGKVTRLMTKDLPDVPGKEGMVETVDFAPGEVSQPHRHNADLFVYVLEGSVITQVKGGSLPDSSRRRSLLRIAHGRTHRESQCQ